MEICIQGLRISAIALSGSVKDEFWDQGNTKTHSVSGKRLFLMLCVVF